MPNPPLCWRGSNRMNPYIKFRDEIVSLDPERYPPAYIDHMVASGEWRCWGTTHAVILAEIKTYPSGSKELHGVAAAGELRAIIGLIALAEEWARGMGCTRSVIESRPAWVKALPDYELHQVSVRKEL